MKIYKTSDIMRHDPCWSRARVAEMVGNGFRAADVATAVRDGSLEIDDGLWVLTRLLDRRCAFYAAVESGARVVALQDVDLPENVIESAWGVHADLNDGKRPAYGNTYNIFVNLDDVDIAYPADDVLGEAQIDGLIGRMVDRWFIDRLVLWHERGNELLAAHANIERPDEVEPDIWRDAVRTLPWWSRPRDRQSAWTVPYFMSVSCLSTSTPAPSRSSAQPASRAGAPAPRSPRI